MASVAVINAATPTISSAAGILALLEEQDNTLRAHALEELHTIVDHFWAEIADAVPLIESLAEDESFSHRELASSVASKCFFHLEEYGDALRLALGAGKYFDVNCQSQYAETLIATCIDEYIALRISQFDDSANVTIDPRMEDIVERVFNRCYTAGTYSQALGIALESRRLDKVEESLNKAPNAGEVLSYCFELCSNIISNREFRLKVFKLMVETYNKVPSPDYSSICQCLQILNNDKEVSSILEKLIRGSDVDALTCYQVAFDLCENESQQFLSNVYNDLPSPVPASTTQTNKEEAKSGDAMDTSSSKEDAEKKSKEENSTPLPPPPAGASADYWSRLSNLKSILSRQFTTEVYLDFLFRNYHADPLLMKQIKTSVENRNSVLHNSAVVAHAYLNAGTAVDSFLRENLEWMGRASNWAKFTATASIGMVHKGHVKESMNLLQPYLPQGGVSASPYSEGGALYALGLIHANNNSQSSIDALKYIRNALTNSGSEEIVQHGACLGIGLSAMATHNYEIYEELKSILFTDAAVAGEGAGLSIGLLMLGAGSSDTRNGDIVTELLSYAHDTKHEKIIRGVVLGIALMMYGREEEADGLIEQLTRDKDPIIRYGGMYAIAMAYCGTSNNGAIRRLLHVAVSDVSDDVRRAAVSCLGFILFRNPVQVPRLVSLLAESFNPHVRYGACMAVGIACAGTAKNEAIQLLEPMMTDAVDYVRQGAMIAIAMVMMQESEGRNGKAKTVRDNIQKIILDKHQSTMTKMGAIIAQGILDAGGNNVSISMQSRTGFIKASSVAGLAIWAQYWFWYPLSMFLSLSLEPTAIIGLNKNLNLPKDFGVKCNAKPSMYSYPEFLKEKKEEKKELVATAVLSTTAKAKARQAKIEAKDKMTDNDENKEESKKEDAMEVDTEEEKKKDEEDDISSKKKEPNFFVTSNPARMTKAQLDVSINNSERYVPAVSGKKLIGIVMLRDTKPDVEEDVIVVQPPSDGEEEAQPPEPFEWEPPKSE